MRRAYKEDNRQHYYGKVLIAIRDKTQPQLLRITAVVGAI